MSEIEKKRITPEKKNNFIKKTTKLVYITQGFFLNPALIIATCELRLHNLFWLTLFFFSVERREKIGPQDSFQFKRCAILKFNARLQCEVVIFAALNHYDILIS